MIPEFEIDILNLPDILPVLAQSSTVYIISECGDPLTTGPRDQFDLIVLDAHEDQGGRMIRMDFHSSLYSALRDAGFEISWLSSGERRVWVFGHGYEPDPESR